LAGALPSRHRCWPGRSYRLKRLGERIFVSLLSGPMRQSVGLQSSSMMGSSVDTITVDAVFVTSTAFIDTNEQSYNVLLGAVNNAIPAIKNKVEVK
jgi:hypothetical protein